MTDDIADPNEGPSFRAPLPTCLFCGAIDCQWVRNLDEMDEMGWHPATLTGQPIAHLAIGWGKFAVEYDTFRRMRLCAILDADHSGPELARRMRNVARAQAIVAAAADSRSKIIS